MGLPSYKINQQDVSVEQLEGRLSSIFSIRADKVMFVKGDDNLDFSTIASGDGHGEGRWGGTYWPDDREGPAVGERFGPMNRRHLQTFPKNNRRSFAALRMTPMLWAGFVLSQV